MVVENWALQSRGAKLTEVVSAHCQSGITKLLRIDELGYASNPDELTVERGMEPRVLEPARQKAGWSGDPSIYFARDWGRPASTVHPQLVVELGQGCSISRIGFMDTPWDRNYGRQFLCFVSGTGRDDDWQEFGSAELEDLHVDRGDPLRYCLRNVWVSWQGEGEPPVARYVGYVWPFAWNKRVYHLYAFGTPLHMKALSVRLEEREGGQTWASCRNLNGDEQAAVPVDAGRTTVSELREAVASEAGLPAWRLNLVLGERIMSAESDAQTLEAFLELAGGEGGGAAQAEPLAAANTKQQQQ